MKTNTKHGYGSYAFLGEFMVHILICDDDPLFVHTMYKKIISLPSYSAKSMNVRGISDISAITADVFSQCDILFLDIDLGEKNGIDLARAMRKRNPETVLIFVTNFNEYAPEGYEVNAFRYLSKLDLDQKLPIYFSDALAVHRKCTQNIEILCEGENVSIPVQALLYIESRGHEQSLHLVGGSRDQLFTRLTMYQLENLLFSLGFLRIHKSFLVNMVYLQSLQSTGAVLTTGQSLPVGARSYRENKQKFIKWKARQIW